MTDNRPIESKGKYDVLVIGGGIAGVAAAVAASRNGASVLLIEKQINLGGLATVGLISWYEPLCNGNGKLMSSGLPEELLRLSIAYGFDDLPQEWGGTGKNKSNTTRFATHFSPTIYALVLEDFVRKNGVEIRFDTLASYPVMDGNICKGIVVETVSGKEFYQGNVIIDATGTAVISYNAGIPTECGDNWCTYVVHDFKKEDVENFHTDMSFCKLRHWSSVGGNLEGVGAFEGVPLLHGDTSDDVNLFIRTGKQNFLNKIKKQDKDSYDITMISSMPQYRKIRHIIGEYVFDGTEDGIEFSDSIGKCGDFRKAGREFTIPFRSLYNKNFPNILTAGRIISASGDGWEITRVIPVCVLTGEAAGTAAALCSKGDCNVNNLNILELQKTLVEWNVNI